MKTQLISKLVSALLLAAAPSAFAQRTVMVNSNSSAVIYPTNLWSANAAEIRSGLGLSAVATNSIIPLVIGGTGATNAAGARTNLGLGASWLTNTDVTNFRTAIGLGSTNDVQFKRVLFDNFWRLTSSPDGGGVELRWGAQDSLAVSMAGGYLGWGIRLGSLGGGAADFSYGFTTNNLTGAEKSRENFGFNTNLNVFWTSTNVGSARTNLGLGWSALTNTNTTNFLTALFGTNTNPVLVNTNGSVTSPTNFWSYAPGAVTIQDFTTNVLTSTTNQVTGARNVFVYSFTTNVTGATHTLELPTNALSGDFVTVTHTGPTSSITAVRTAGTTNNLVNLSQVEEQVRFVYRNSAWRIEPPRALTTPLYFSGSSASANAAASRTNLGIPLAALTNTDVTNFQRAIFVATNAAPSVTTNIAAWVDIRIGTNTNSFKLPLYQ